MKKATIIITSILAIITCIVLYYFINREAALKLLFPDITKINYISLNLKNDSVYTKLQVVAENKSPYKLAIDTVYLRIEFNGDTIALEEIPIQLNLDRYDTDSLDLHIRFAAKKISENIKKLKGKDSTTLNIYTTTIYNTFWGKQKIKLKKESRIAVPIPPQIKIVKVERKRFNAFEKKLYATVTVEIINKGKLLNFELNNITYSLTVKETLQSKGIYKQNVFIKPQSSIQLELPVIIDLDHPLKTGWLILTDNDVLTYELNIHADTKQNSLGGHTAPVDFNTTGIIELVK